MLQPQLTIASLIAVVSWADLASAQEAPAESPPASDQPQDVAPPPPTPTLVEALADYEFVLVAGAWRPRLHGTSTLGGGGTDILFEEDFDLDDAELITNIEFSLRKNDKWELSLTGFDFSTDQTDQFLGTASYGDLTLNTGDTFRAEFDITSVAAEVSYWAQPRKLGKRADGRESRIDVRLAPLIGIRYFSIDHALEVIGEGSESVDGEWAALVFGGRIQFRFDLPDSIPILHILDLSGSAGVGPALGGEGGFVSHISASMTGYISNNIGINFGYRLIEMDVEVNDYEFGGGLQGLFLGVSLRF